MNTYNGTELSSAREDRGFTISAASRHLSIPDTTLEALESNRFDMLPPECFTAGFLRSYCEFLELPAEAFVDAYQRSLRGAKDHSRSAGRRLTDFIGERVSKFVPPLPPELISWGTITIVVLSAWLAYSSVFRPQAKPEDSQASAAIHDLRLPQDDSSELPR